MGKLLAFFAGGLQLRALIIGAAVMAIAILALTAWALWERGGRYQAERDVVTYKAQSAVLADKLDTCNKSVDAVAQIGDTIKRDLRGTLAAIRTAGQPLRNEIASIAEILKRPPPARADGQPADCNDAWREIESGRMR